MENRSSLRYAAIGTSAVLALALLVRICLGLFTQEFENAAEVTVQSDRAGLLLETNAAVKFRGVPVGRIAGVELHGDEAEITLALRPGTLKRIPANVTAAVLPTTFLGAKFVELREGDEPSATRLQAGAVIRTVHNTAELNQTFDSLAKVLGALEPAAVNTVLHSLSASLEGQGTKIRAILGDAGEVLPALNRRTANIEAVLRILAPTLSGYAGLTDPLTNTMVNAGSISTLLASRGTELTQLLISLTEAGFDVGAVLADLEPSLGAATATLRPTLELLASYSDVIPCILRGHVEFAKRARAVFGGPNKGGTHRNGHVTLSIVRSQPAYQYGKNLPKVGATGAPNCHGLPLPNGLPPFTPYDVGANPYPNLTDQSSPPTTPLGVYLFGTQLNDLERR